MGQDVLHLLGHPDDPRLLRAQVLGHEAPGDGAGSHTWMHTTRGHQHPVVSQWSRLCGLVGHITCGGLWRSVPVPLDVFSLVRLCHLCGGHTELPGQKLKRKAQTPCVLSNASCVPFQ